ncbi:MAG: hypothetical protein OQJ98_00585 [Candidatus Pacebacteria bacterium]|nr:hypothetical protein [Candidatus Paceibacterota bacterium]
MLGFPCAHCGNIEFLHQTHQVSDAGFYDGLTPLHVPIDEEKFWWGPFEERKYQEAKRKPGYQHDLLTCPGFEHRKQDLGMEMVRRAIEENLPGPHLLPLPKQLIEKVREGIQEKRPNLFGGGLTRVYFNRGASFVAIGE